jgi:prepilin signal peptidase PulO-like enzyme (type II secretory pathway)
VELSPPSEQKPAAVQDRPSARENFRSLPYNQRVVISGASAVLVVGSFVRFGFSGHALVGAILAPTLVLLAAIDLDRRLIPDVIVLPALAAVLILQIAFYPEHTLEWVLAMFGAALFLFIPMLISPAAMGMGDVKLAALLGAALGKSVGAALFVGLLAGGAYGLVVFAREGLAARRKAIAFGPFLALGGLVVFFLGGH